MHGVGKDAVLCPAPPNGRKATQHPTWRIKKQDGFSMGIRRLGDRGLHTARSVAQIFVGVVFNVSSHLYDFCCRPGCM